MCQEHQWHPSLLNSKPLFFLTKFWYYLWLAAHMKSTRQTGIYLLLIFKKLLNHWIQMMLLKVKILPEHQGANMGTSTSSAQVQNNQMFLLDLGVAARHWWAEGHKHIVQEEVTQHRWQVLAMKPYRTNVQME